MKLKQFLTFFLNNKIDALGLIAAFFGAFYLIPAWFDDEGFNEYLCGVSFFYTSIFQKTLLENQENLHEWVKRSPKYASFYRKSICVTDANKGFTRFINGALNRIMMKKSVDDFYFNRLKEIALKQQNNSLKFVEPYNRQSFNEGILPLYEGVGQGLSLTQQKLFLQLVKQVNLANINHFNNYFSDRANGVFSTDNMSIQRLILSVANQDFRLGSELVGKAFCGKYRHDYTNIQFKVNKLPVNMKDGVAHYAKKENSLGEKQFIVSAFIKNWENDSITEQRNTFYYEVVP